MQANDAFARRLRQRRLHRHHHDRLFIVPLDHSITNGPIAAGGRLDHLVGQLAGNVDAVVLHKGCIRHISDQRFAETSLIVHLSASTSHAPDPDAKYLVGNVEECLRLGADAVSVHVNLGAHDERRQIADLAGVAEACDRWNLPLLAMVYPRGPQIEDPRNPELAAHAVTIAADLGADLIKTVYPGTPEEMADVTRCCPVPIVVAGGEPMQTIGEVTSYVTDALRGGAHGVAMGRNIFAANDPGEMARTVSRALHRRDPARKPAGGLAAAG